MFSNRRQQVKRLKVCVWWYIVGYFFKMRKLCNGRIAKNLVNFLDFLFRNHRCHLFFLETEFFFFFLFLFVVCQILNQLVGEETWKRKNKDYPLEKQQVFKFKKSKATSTAQQSCQLIDFWLKAEYKVGRTSWKKRSLPRMKIGTKINKSPIAMLVRFLGSPKLIKTILLTKFRSKLSICARQRNL